MNPTIFPAPAAAAAAGNYSWLIVVAIVLALIVFADEIARLEMKRRRYRAREKQALLEEIRSHDAEEGQNR